MADILPRALPPADSVPDDAAFIVDNGVNVQKATPVQIVTSGRPLANQSEAEAGIEPTKAMTPLTTAQAIAAQGAVQFATAAQGELADTSVQPGDLGTLAAKDQISVPTDIDASGTPSASTYLAGDGEWRTPPGAGDMEKSVYDPSNTGVDLANLPRVDAAQSFTQGQKGQVLANIGAAWEQIGPVVTPSGVASVDWTGLSAYVSLRLSGYILPATDATRPIIRTSTDNGVSFDAGASDYRNAQYYGAPNAALSSGNVDADGIYLSFGQTVGNVAYSEGLTFQITFQNFNKAGVSKFDVTSTWNNDAGAWQQMPMGSGRRNSTTARDALRILFNSGNIASGRLILEGIRG